MFCFPSKVTKEFGEVRLKNISQAASGLSSKSFLYGEFLGQKCLPYLGIVVKLYYLTFLKYQIFEPLLFLPFHKHSVDALTVEE